MKSEKEAEPLRRQRHPIPEFIRSALEKGELMAAYRERPPYQQNDYLRWITRARTLETKQKRLAHMLDELSTGERYLNMPFQVKPHG